MLGGSAAAEVSCIRVGVLQKAALSRPSSWSPQRQPPVTLRELRAVVTVLRGGLVLLLTVVIKERVQIYSSRGVIAGEEVVIEEIAL